MVPNGKRLLDNRTAARASLRGAMGVNQHDFTTSIFCFVREILYQLAPGRIRDAFCQTVILEHVLSVQFFKRNYAIFVHQLAREFVRKVLAPIGNSLVDMLYGFTASCPIRRSLFCLGKFTLRLCQFFLIPAKEAVIGNFFTVAERNKTFQPNVNSKRHLRFWQRFGVNLTREVGVPVPHRITVNVECLDLPADWPVKEDLDYADLRQVQASAP